jgi:hypothetical protein
MANPAVALPQPRRKRTNIFQRKKKNSPPGETEMKTYRREEDIVPPRPIEAAEMRDRESQPLLDSKQLPPLPLSPPSPPSPLSPPPSPFTTLPRSKLGHRRQSSLHSYHGVPQDGNGGSETESQRHLQENSSLPLSRKKENTTYEDLGEELFIIPAEAEETELGKGPTDTRKRQDSVTEESEPARCRSDADVQTSIVYANT